MYMNIYIYIYLFIFLAIQYLFYGFAHIYIYIFIYLYSARSFNLISILHEIYVKGESVSPAIPHAPSRPRRWSPPAPFQHPTHLRSCWPRELVKWLGRLSGRFQEIPGRFQHPALAFGASAGTTCISPPEKIIPDSARVLNKL